MLPSVANQLIHHTSRAVAAVQNQTGHTIRNVLHIQSSTPTTVGNRNGPGSSSSGRGSNGAGAGGARKNGSNRFHSTYSALSRSVSQADTSLLHSITVEGADEADDVVNATPSAVSTRHVRQRARSGSFALSALDRESLQKSGLLHALQQHVRATHAFASTPPSTARVAESDAQERTATASVESTEVSVRSDEQEELLITSLRHAKTSNDRALVLSNVEKIRQSKHPHSPSVYNAALDALHRTRKNGGSLEAILELYNDMVARSVLPNGATYTVLITALTERDVEVVAQISFVNERAKKLTHLGKYIVDVRRGDEARLQKLHRENNLSSALALFQAGCLLRGHSFSRNVYSTLLRSCAAAGNVDAALRVFSHLEKRLVPSIVAYHYLLEAHSKSGDLDGAREVFSAYNSAAKAGRVEPDSDAVHPSGAPIWRDDHLAIWNEMIVSNIYHGQVPDALAVLEQMLGPDASPEFELGHVPSPSPSTFTGIVQGFIRTGDTDSALTWFDRLLQEPALPGVSDASHLRPTKPSAKAWKIMIEALAYSMKIDELNRIVDIAYRDKLYELDGADRFLLLQFNLQRLRELPLEQLEAHRATLNQLVDRDLKTLNPYATDSIGLLSDVSYDVIGVYFAISKLYMALEDHERLLGSLEWIVHSVLKDTQAAELDGSLSSDHVMQRKQALRALVVTVCSTLWFKDPAPVRPFHYSMRLASLSGPLDLLPRQPIAGHYVRSYVESSDQDKDLLSFGQWELFIQAACNAVYEIPGQEVHPDYSPIGIRPLDIPHNFDPITILVDLSKRGVDVRAFSREVQRRLSKALIRSYGRDGAFSRLQELSPTAASALADVLHSPETRVRLPSEGGVELPMELPDTVSSSVVQIDIQHSRFVDEFASGNGDLTPVHAYARFQAGAQKGIYPRPEVIGRLIAALGRLKEVEKAHDLYKASQLVLAVMENEKESQSLGWFQVEDQMVIGLAHAGEVEAAHIHRARILEQGGCLSADAYGALIENVTDTTDDTTNAMALFEESRARGTHPNIYLYNTIISKLAKARKADHAIEMFREMKAQYVRPTSVTYGALIAACCRVGDAISAETLFAEMTAQKNFRPRVPPYNTMMQLYTQTKPDRDRVLYYFNEMRRVNVKPTAHTYKLLMDAYGTIEPIDLTAMHNIFNTLVADRNVCVQGTHWAALINAWGCAKKDLDEAIKIFESIPAHPSSQRSQGSQPDAVVFEALTNVFVTLRRPDLIAEYRAKIPELGIQMTAYIANLLIKGYAAAGDIEEARNIFESLADPPEGVAAPYNHASHSDQSSPPSSQRNLPNGAVYREPSTWEAMVRAELGHGNREQAIALLERVQARRFPPAVYNRISGIMLDDSVSPWGRGSEASAPSTP